MAALKPPAKVQSKPIAIGALVVVAKVRSDPYKTRAGRWWLDRVTASTGMVYGAIEAVESGEPLTQPPMWPGRIFKAGSYSLALPATFRAREAWAAYLAEGRPVWRSRDDARAWAKRWLP